MGYNIKDFLQKPLPFLGKEGKTMLIGFTSVLMVLILIGPQFGLNLINLDNNFIFITWRWFLGIIFAFIAIWSFLKSY